MIGLIPLLIVLLFSLVVSKKTVFTAVLCILPFHVLFISVIRLFENNQATILLVSSWKEIAAGIILCKMILNRKDISIPRRDIALNSLLFLFIYYVLVSLLMTTQFRDAILSVKNFVFPILIFWIAYRMPLMYTYSEKFIKAILIAAIGVFIIGHIQTHILEYEVAALRGIIDSISPSEKIYYAATAFSILDMNRMYGPFAGPNELGLYTALVVVLTYYLIISKGKFPLNISNKLLWISLTLGILTLFQTFSRVSWAFAIVSVLTITFYSMKRRLFYRGFITGVFIVLFILMAGKYIPGLKEVYTATVEMKELSASSRAQYFFDGFERVIDNPFGYGLGQVFHRSSKQKYGTEIFWWLVSLELGISGLLILALIYFSLFRKAISNYRRGDRNVFSLPAATFALIYIFAGLGSIIVFEPIFLVYIWSIIGLSFNHSIENYECFLSSTHYAK